MTTEKTTVDQAWLEGTKYQRRSEWRMMAVSWGMCFVTLGAVGLWTKRGQPPAPQAVEQAPRVGYPAPQAPEAHRGSDMRRDFWATVMWEHRGLIRVHDVGDGGTAHGLIQAKGGYLQDANEQLAKEGLKQYTLADMKQVEPAYAVYSAYMRRYNARTGEMRARTHNQLSTRHGNFSDGYWRGVQTYYDVEPKWKKP